MGVNFSIPVEMYYMNCLELNNLISTSLIVQHGFKLIFEYNKVVITKNESFNCKGYLGDELFILIAVNSPLIRCDLSSFQFQILIYLM